MEFLSIKIDDDHSFEFAHLKDPSFWAKQQVVNSRYPELISRPIFPHDYYVYTHFEVIPYYESNLFKFLPDETKMSDAILDRIAVKFYVKDNCVAERTLNIEWKEGFEYRIVYEIEKILYRDLTL